MTLGYFVGVLIFERGQPRNSVINNLRVSVDHVGTTLGAGYGSWWLTLKLFVRPTLT